MWAVNGDTRFFADVTDSHARCPIYCENYSTPASCWVPEQTNLVFIPLPVWLPAWQSLYTASRASVDCQQWFEWNHHGWPIQTNATANNNGVTLALLWVLCLNWAGVIVLLECVSCHFCYFFLSVTHMTYRMCMFCSRHSSAEIRRHFSGTHGFHHSRSNSNASSTGYLSVVSSLHLDFIGFCLFGSAIFIWFFDTLARIWIIIHIIGIKWILYLHILDSVPLVISLWRFCFQDLAHCSFAEELCGFTPLFLFVSPYPERTKSCLDTFSLNTAPTWLVLVLESEKIYCRLGCAGDSMLLQYLLKASRPLDAAFKSKSPYMSAQWFSGQNHTPDLRGKTHKCLSA